MINLITNELVKIFNKKSTYIFLFLILIFVFFTNYLYKYKIDENGNYITYIDRNKEIEKYNNLLNNCNSNCDNYKYLLEVNKMYNKYGENSFQGFVVERYYDNYSNNYDLYNNLFIKNDYKSVIKDLINNNISNKEKDILNYKLNNNLELKYDYLYSALDNLKSDDKEIYNKAKYILNTKVNLNKVNDTRGIFINFFNEYEAIIIMFIILISCSIISDEFKGMIKSLLIMPYSRNKILISKFLSVVLLFIFILIYIFLLQLIFGGLFFSYNSLKIPVLIYNYSSNNLITMNIFKYILLILLNKLPLFLITIILSMFLSIVTLNNALSSILMLLNYLVITPIVSNIKLFRYLINIHWDLSIYLYGRTIPNMNFNTSILLCIIYFIIIFVSLLVIFDKKDIKNI